MTIMDLVWTQNSKALLQPEYPSFGPLGGEVGL